MEVVKGTIGTTLKKRFYIALLSGLLLFGTLLATFGFTGTLFALPLGGMGDFYVEFDRLEGKGFQMSPHIGETGHQDQAPLVRNQIDTAVVEGLHIYKDLKMPTGNWIRINIKSDQPTTISGLIQDARFVDANLVFDEMQMQNRNTSNAESSLEEFTKNWGQNASAVTITDAKIVTDYLFQNLVTLNGAKISIEGITDPERISTEESSGGIVSGGEDGGSTGGDGALPNTASNIFLPIVIGCALLVAGIVLFILKRKKIITETKNT